MWAIAVVFAAIWVYIATPRYTICYPLSKEGRLRSDLKHYRNAVQLFLNDTGVLPRTLDDLSAATAPAWGYVYAKGCRKPINPKKWKGPYLDAIMNDPCSGNPYIYRVGSGNVLSSDPDHRAW